MEIAYIKFVLNCSCKNATENTTPNIDDEQKIKMV